MSENIFQCLHKDHCVWEVFFHLLAWDSLCACLCVSLVFHDACFDRSSSGPNSKMMISFRVLLHRRTDRFCASRSRPNHMGVVHRPCGWHWLESACCCSWKASAQALIHPAVVGMDLSLPVATAGRHQHRHWFIQVFGTDLNLPVATAERHQHRHWFTQQWSARTWIYLLLQLKGISTGIDSPNSDQHGPESTCCYSWKASAQALIHPTVDQLHGEQEAPTATEPSSTFLTDTDAEKLRDHHEPHLPACRRPSRRRDTPWVRTPKASPPSPLSLK